VKDKVADRGLHDGRLVLGNLKHGWTGVETIGERKPRLLDVAMVGGRNKECGRTVACVEMSLGRSKAT
jgi:hypothetical protein